MDLKQRIIQVKVKEIKLKQYSDQNNSPKKQETRYLK